MLVPGMKARDKFLYQMEPVFDQDETVAVADCIRSGWVTEAELTVKFERSVADFVGAKYAVAVPSCTVALTLSLMALGIGRGDEVLVPDLTFVATANAVSLTGATPIFVDISAETLGLNPRLIPLAITAKTKAILPVWFNGYDPNIHDIMSIANEYGLAVVEDAACALGSRSQQQHAGTFGNLGCFSFNSTKIITTGTGGMIVTDDDVLFEQVKRLKNHGRLDRRDYHPLIGYNFYYSDLLAALGVAQMRKLPARVAWKNQLCHWYCDRLEQLDNIQTRRPSAETCAWYPDLFVENRASLKEYLASKNIQTRLYYPPIHTQPSYRCEQTFACATQIASQGVWLPSAAYVDEKTVERVCAEIRRWSLSV